VGSHDRLWRNALDVSATIAVIGLCGTLVWLHLSSRPAASAASAANQPSRRQELPPPTAPISLDGAVLKGSLQAPVGVVEFADFQCPFCAVFTRDTLPMLEEQYVRAGKVLFAFRQLPLERIHKVALAAAEAAVCAGDQGRFWEMHDWIFGNQKTLTPASLRTRALALHLDDKAFAGCVATGATARVKADIQRAASLQISGTPTFFVGRIGVDGDVRVTRRLTGARPAAEFIAAIEAALAEDTVPTSNGRTIKPSSLR